MISATGAECAALTVRRTAPAHTIFPPNVRGSDSNHTPRQSRSYRYAHCSWRTGGCASGSVKRFITLHEPRSICRGYASRAPRTRGPASTAEDRGSRRADRRAIWGQCPPGARRPAHSRRSIIRRLTRWIVPSAARHVCRSCAQVATEGNCARRSRAHNGLAPHRRTLRPRSQWRPGATLIGRVPPQRHRVGPGLRRD